MLEEKHKSTRQTSEQTPDNQGTPTARPGGFARFLANWGVNPHTLDLFHDNYEEFVYKRVARKRRLEYYARLVLSAGIAGVGLQLDNVAIIIGAMLISPLMDVIFGLVVGLFIREEMDKGTLIFQGFAKHFVFSVLASIVVGGVTAFLLNLTEIVSSPHPQVLGQAVEAINQLSIRVRPTIVDFVVAFLIGLAAVIIVFRMHTAELAARQAALEEAAESSLLKSKQKKIAEEERHQKQRASIQRGLLGAVSIVAGVAIGVSVIPPLSAAGIFFVYSRWVEGLGALLLFFSNFLAIFLASLLFISVTHRYHFIQERPEIPTLRRRIKLLIALSVSVILVFMVLMVVFTSPLILVAGGIVLPVAGVVLFVPLFSKKVIGGESVKAHSIGASLAGLVLLVVTAVAIPLTSVLFFRLSQAEGAVQTQLEEGLNVHTRGQFRVSSLDLRPHPATYVSFLTREYGLGNVDAREGFSVMLRCDVVERIFPGSEPAPPECIAEQIEVVKKDLASRFGVGDENVVIDLELTRKELYTSGKLHP